MDTSTAPTNQRFDRSGGDTDDAADIARRQNMKPPPPANSTPPDPAHQQTAATFASSTDTLANISSSSPSPLDAEEVEEQAPLGHPPEHSTKNSDKINVNTDEKAKKKTIKDYIPHYLKRYIQPAGSRNHNDEDDDFEDSDFCMSNHVTSTKLVAHCMMEGFLPMAYNDSILLPKLHAMRSIISLRKSIYNHHSNEMIPIPLPQMTSNNTSNQLSYALHVSKNARKRAKHYYMTMNTAFDTVVEHCQQQHGSAEQSGSCWLYPSLLKLFRTLHVATIQKRDGYITICSTPQSNHQQEQQISIRLFSIEVWNAETSEFAAGEIGYTIGDTIYTSLTGCCVEDSAGSVQTAALGALLIYLQSFCLWDLGMDMPYKQTLGSQLLPRQDFVALLHTLRTIPQLGATGTTTASGSTNARAFPVSSPLSSIQWPIQQLNEAINCRDIINAISTPRGNACELTSSTATREVATSPLSTPLRPLNKKQRKELKKQSRREK